MTEFVDIHADDYALSEHSDNDILALCKAGKLTSISILPNMDRFADAVQAFKTAQPAFVQPVRVSVHLNVMEGRCCANKELVPDLVDADGFFTVSWGKLVAWSYNPFMYARIKKQLITEICAQTEAVIACGLIDRAHVRFDSHQHPHMIPIVYAALLAAIDTMHYGVDFIRNSEDPLHLYFAEWALYPSYSAINAVKCIILNVYSWRVRHALHKRNLPCTVLCGVFFSGHMDALRVQRVLPRFVRFAHKKNRSVEVLFHPGTMLASEITPEFSKPGFIAFHLDEGRKIEYSAVNTVQYGAMQ